ncbi:hypothetical protein Y032_0011g1409 [Ancylostoma ceylanicum]|nr:hypothetical protein Y032_0011g1409 [Ancylostoma ceylanicum]
MRCTLVATWHSDCLYLHCHSGTNKSHLLLFLPSNSSSFPSPSAAFVPSCATVRFTSPFRNLGKDKSYEVGCTLACLCTKMHIYL